MTTGPMNPLLRPLRPVTTLQEITTLSSLGPAESQAHVPGCVRGFGSGERRTMQSLGGPDWKRPACELPGPSGQTARAARPADRADDGRRMGTPRPSSQSEALAARTPSNLGASLPASNPTIVEKGATVAGTAGDTFAGDLGRVTMDMWASLQYPTTHHQHTPTNSSRTRNLVPCPPHLEDGPASGPALSEARSPALR